jgi:outer membrane protein OmpA-like peptidoglycan-associated protein
MLLNPQVSCEDAAWFVLQAAGTPADVSPFAFAQAKKWLPGEAIAGDPIKLGQVSLLIMRAFNIKGGFMYSLFHSPHHACRELVYRKLIQGPSDPSLLVSGEQFLHILSRVLSFAGQEDAPAREALVRTETEGEQGRERITELINIDLERISDTAARVTDEGITISLNNVQFVADSMELQGSEKGKIRDIAAILKKYPDRKILVGGHTALAGTAEGRMQVSTERAKAVADYLILLGAFTPAEISIRGYGAERPLGDNATPEGQAINRRVEITLLDAERGR